MIDHEKAECPERRKALIATEPLLSKIDIAELSETRLAERGSIDEIFGNNGCRSFGQESNWKPGWNQE